MLLLGSKLLKSSMAVLLKKPKKQNTALLYFYSGVIDSRQTFGEICMTGNVLECAYVY